MEKFTAPQLITIVEAGEARLNFGPVYDGFLGKGSTPAPPTS